jgi:hypothetical protein
VSMGQLVADAVEKVCRKMPARNNRIEGTDILNRSCAFDAYLESIFLEEPLKIFFRQHRPVCEISRTCKNESGHWGNADSIRLRCVLRLMTQSSPCREL